MESKDGSVKARTKDWSGASSPTGFAAAAQATDGGRRGSRGAIGRATAASSASRDDLADEIVVVETYIVELKRLLGQRITFEVYTQIDTLRLVIARKLKAMDKRPGVYAGLQRKRLQEDFDRVCADIPAPPERAALPPGVHAMAAAPSYDGRDELADEIMVIETYLVELRRLIDMRMTYESLTQMETLRTTIALKLDKLGERPGVYARLQRKRLQGDYDRVCAELPDIPVSPAGAAGAGDGDDDGGAGARRRAEAARLRLVSDTADHDEAARREEAQRTARASAIARDMRDLKEVASDVSSLVDQGRERIDVVERNADLAEASAADAVEELHDAARINNSTFVKKSAAVGGVILGAVGIIGGPKGVAAGAALGGAMGGWIGKKVTNWQGRKLDAAVEDVREMRRRDLGGGSGAGGAGGEGEDSPRL